MIHRRRPALGSALLVLTTLALALFTPQRAHAEEQAIPFVSPGPVWSASPSEDRAGSGIEVSAGAVVPRAFYAFFGAVYRGQRYANPDLDGNSYARYTVAFEGGFPLGGLELGYAWRERMGDADGVHLAPFLSAVGLVSAGPQLLFPIDGTPVRWEMNVTFKPAPLLFFIYEAGQPKPGGFRLVGAR